MAQYDKYGFNKYGFYKDTEQLKDKYGFYRREYYPYYADFINEHCDKEWLNQNGFDENGFDSESNNFFTRDSYDKNGFNKDGTEHKDTKSPRNNDGYKREYYLNITHSTIHNYYKEKIKHLFYEDKDLFFIKIIDEILQNELANRIELKNYNALTDYKSTTPTCVDGSPDMRYKSSGSVDYRTYIELSIVKTNSDTVSMHKTMNARHDKDYLIKVIEKYNYYLSSMRDKKIRNLYAIILEIDNEWKKNSRIIQELVVIEKDKKDLFKKLSEYQDKFSEQQQQDFNKLAEDIKATVLKIETVDNFRQEFEDIYQKLKIELEVFSIKSNEIKVDDEISDLFSQLNQG